jgi:hypothetical protein
MQGTAMKIRNVDGAKAALQKPNRFMMVTYQQSGETFSLDNGAAVPKGIARQLQGDLFVRPSEDGLFPGCSQTFKMVD